MFLAKVFFILLLVFPSFFAFAQLSPSEEREQLELELQKLEEEIGSIEGDITRTKAEKKTLQNQISILKNKIRKLDLEIQKSNTIIQDIRLQIDNTTESIGQTIQNIEQKREQLSIILRRIARQDRKGFAEVVLTGNTLSDFFSNLVALQTLNEKNRELLENLRELQNYLSQQKNKLEEEKEEEENFRKIQILQKQESQGTQRQNEVLLEQTKGKESEYQKLLADRKKRAQEIRSRIFDLIGVPEAPTFGEALEIAKFASNQTSIRPAFLLAVLTQESNIGKNVGQCFLKDTETGSGVKVFSGASVAKVMKPSRDIQPFLQITQELERDPFNTPISCPIPSVGGYGGAMGPAQFIPSTWMRYRDRLSSLLGRSADPWNIKDAFLAAAVYLANAGANSQTYNAEWRAALLYFSGSTNTRYRFYGDSVMRIASDYEVDIKALENGS